MQTICTVGHNKGATFLDHNSHHVSWWIFTFFCQSPTDLRALSKYVVEYLFLSQLLEKLLKFVKKYGSFKWHVFVAHSVPWLF